MICHVLFTVAAHYKIICDDKIKPLNSIEPFKSPNDRLLYDTLIEYMDGYQRKRGFMKFLRTIHQHINDYEMKRKCRPSVTVIKLLYAINIAAKFQLGEPSYDFLDFAPNFDEGLIEHWSKICTYNMQVIERSLCKPFKDYREQDYYINKSVSYIALSYITLVYEIILYQVEHNRWSWASGDYFEEHIGEFVENTDNIARFVFLKQNCYRTNVNLDMVNIFSHRLTYDKASSLLQEMKGNPINIHAVYSRFEVLKALKLYSNQKKSTMSSDATDHIVWMLKSIQDNSDFLATQNTIKDLIYNGDIAIPYIEICPPARYEFFFGTNGDICENHTFEQWKRDTVALEAELRAMDYLITLWLQGRLQRSITFDE